MPGGILDNIGNFFGGIGAAMNPAIQENQFRRGAYNALAQQNGPQDAAILMGAPGAYGLAMQRQIFLDQLRELMGPDPNNPKMGLNEALYAMSPKGAGETFGNPTPVPGYKFGPYEAPGFVVGRKPVPPPGFPGTAPSSPQQQPPSSQPGPSNASISGAPQSTLPPVAQAVLDYTRQEAAAKSRGEEEGSAQTNVSGSVDQIDRSIKLIDELAQHPGMKWATGALGSLPPIPNTSAYSFVKGLDQLKDQLTLDILPSLQRKGNRISPALIELLQKSTAGQELDRNSPDFPRALQNTRNALVQIRGATQRMANVPVSEAPQAEGGPPTFGSQAELRAAIKGGKIKVGEPFRTNDGRTLLAQ